MYKNIITALSMFVCLGLNAQYNFDHKKLETIRWSPFPEKVIGVQEFKIDLNGSWKFNPAPGDKFWQQKEPLDWAQINVPGEWVMQEFDVDTGATAAYQRNFELPEYWKEKRIKLRCEAVYSECKIWINGKNAGGHLGGFTPFEIDVTRYVKKGNNIITLGVKSESLADSLSSGSKYAVHPLGGITRPVYLLALPEVNISSFHVNTTFDSNYSDASLDAEFCIANEALKGKTVEVAFKLRDKEGKEVSTTGTDRLFVNLEANSKIKLSTILNVSNPEKWDPEHPNLYFLDCSVFVNGKEVEVITRRFGFRQIEVRGNQVFVNNQPVKLRGVCRHEVHPLRGRSLTGDIWYEDVKLFKKGNVNYIRTSHYPPNEKLLEACDELGMFVEVEGPFCWADNTSLSPDQYFDGIIRPVAEMVERDRSHPCLLHWSVANESRKFNEWFKVAADLIKEMDPSRPRIFSQWGSNADDGYLELDNHHYPGPDGSERYKNHKRPITFDEYSHLNAYNRYELMTDPGVRDFWGDMFYNMWENMYQAKGVLGGAIWAGIDDSFFLPSGHVVGYGTWGPLDGWRRKKPEFWHMKKTYSPVKITLVEDEKNGQVKLSVENRYLFSNLKECKIKWQNGNQSGTLSPDIAPGQKKEVELSLKNELIEQLKIDVYNGGQIPVDQYVFDHSRPEIEVVKHSDEKFEWNTKGDTRIGKSSFITVELNKQELRIFNSKGKCLINDWPELMLVPINNEGGVQMTKEVKDYELYSPSASKRFVESIRVDELDGKVKIKLVESYKEAAGVMNIEISADGNIDIDYHYGILKTALYRQWGVVFPVSAEFNKLTWKRKGLWSVYPADHIGRLEGEARMFYNDERCGLAGPSKQPTWNYNRDQTRYGSNDFRSTKRNIFKASLESSQNSLKLLSDGTQHVRCWVDNGQVHMLVAEYDNPGAEKFVRDFVNHAAPYDINLLRGENIEGKILIRLRDVTRK